MRSLLAALALLLVVAAPVTAGKPLYAGNRAPLALVYEYLHYGTGSAECYFEDSVHLRSWVGWMQPGESFDLTLNFCEPGGANSGAYLFVAGDANYAVTFDCLDRYAEPCAVSRTYYREWGNNVSEQWRGCEPDPNGLVAIRVTLLGPKAADTQISAGADHVGSAGWASRCP